MTSGPPSTMERLLHLLARTRSATYRAGGRTENACSDSSAIALHSRGLANEADNLDMT